MYHFCGLCQDSVSRLFGVNQSLLSAFNPRGNPYAFTGMQIPPNIDSPFVILSFLAAPAILTNASTLLALGTSNRLARAADRARSSAQSVITSKDPSDPLVKLHRDDFQAASQRASMLVKALQRFYLSAGCFALGTCVALIGAFLDYFQIRTFDKVSQIGTILIALFGVGGLVHGSLILLAETKIALNTLAMHHAAITQWRATNQPPANPPTM